MCLFIENFEFKKKKKKKGKNTADLQHSKTANLPYTFI
jgi:hypothetical protein